MTMRYINRHYLSIYLSNREHPESADLHQGLTLTSGYPTLEFPVW